ncbi:hypothetical protein [Methanosarcina mazei]|nr:hypothetical protein [Methanosarcina mazei]
MKNRNLRAEKPCKFNSFSQILGRVYSLPVVAGTGARNSLS